MTSASLPTRWIACVDGTWCTPDGAYGLPRSPNRTYTVKALTARFVGNRHDNMLEFGERLDLVLWETCHIYATCQAYRAEADFQHNISNVYRICASIKVGECVDESTGFKFNQVRSHLDKIGSRRPEHHLTRLLFSGRNITTESARRKTLPG